MRYVIGCLRDNRSHGRVAIPLDDNDIAALKAQIAAGKPAELVGTLVIDRVPYIFEGDAIAYRGWREALGPSLGVDPCNLFVVGSAGVGCSLNPYKDWKAFDAKSDVDVAVISSYHFDIAWRIMRLTKRGDVAGRVWEAIEKHRTNYIYWGCITTDRILGHLPFAKEWLEAAATAASLYPTQDRDIKYRIYRDVASLRDYTVNGLKTLKADLVV